jgi:hypothetical protein
VQLLRIVHFLGGEQHWVTNPAARLLLQDIALAQAKAMLSKSVFCPSGTGWKNFEGFYLAPIMDNSKLSES